jgi:glucose uptake protein GlcU
LVTLLAVIAFNEIYQPSALMFGLMAVAIYSIGWTLAYFRPKVAEMVTA